MIAILFLYAIQVLLNSLGISACMIKILLEKKSY